MHVNGFLFVLQGCPSFISLCVFLLKLLTVVTLLMVSQNLGTSLAAQGSFHGKMVGTRPSPSWHLILNKFRSFIHKLWPKEFCLDSVETLEASNLCKGIFGWLKFPKCLHSAHVRNYHFLGKWSTSGIKWCLNSAGTGMKVLFCLWLVGCLILQVLMELVYGRRYPTKQNFVWLISF